MLGRKSAGATKGLSFSRPLVLLQSDDWGRVGVRDREGYEQLRASGIHLGGNGPDSLKRTGRAFRTMCSIRRCTV